MRDYPALKAEIALPVYAGMTDAEIAVSLNAPTISYMQDVICSDARAILFATGEYGGIVLLSREVPSGTVPASLVAAAITAIATLDQAQAIQASNSTAWGAVQQMLGAFVQAGTLSQASNDALLALAPATTSRAEQLGFIPVYEADIQAARKV